MIGGLHRGRAQQVRRQAAIPPGDGAGIEEFIAEFAREMLPLQN